MESIIKDWDIALSLSEKRLQRTNFQLPFQKSMKIDQMMVNMNGSLQNLQIHIASHGLSMIELICDIKGQLQYQNKTISLNGGTCMISAPFHTVKKNQEWMVLPNFHDTAFRINIKADHLDISAKSILETHLKTENVLHEEEFYILKYKDSMMNQKAVKFQTLCVTSTYASYAPSLSSLVLLLNREKKETIPVLDPHIMANGESACVRVSDLLLHDIHGEEILSYVKQKYEQRLKPMHAKIADIDQKIIDWMKSFVEEVQAGEENIQFYGIQALEDEVLLSATKQGIDELDLFTAIDATNPDQNPVQDHCVKLLNDCILYYMNPLYRKYILNQELPTLPKEVLEISDSCKDMYKKLGRLQMAKQIRQGDGGSNVINSKEEILDKSIKSITKSADFINQSNLLYSLSYCVIHPRFSLYLEDKEKWMHEYANYLQSDQHVEKLSLHENAVQMIHEDMAKLSALDLKETLTKQVQETIFGKYLKLFAQRHWQDLIKTYPEEFKVALTQTIERYTTEEVAEDEKENQAIIVGIIDHVGSLATFVEALMTDLTKTAIMDGYVPLSGELTCFQQLWHDHPEFMKTGSMTLSLFVSISAIVVFSIKANDIKKIKDLKGEQYTYAVSVAVVDCLNLLWASTMSIYLSFALVTKLVVHFQASLAESLTSLLANIEEVFAKFMNRAAAFLCFLSAAISIWDTVYDFQEGKTLVAVVDICNALVSILTGFAIAFSWNGVVIIALAIAGLIIGIIRLVLAVTDKKEKEKKKALNLLNQEVLVDVKEK